VSKDLEAMPLEELVGILIIHEHVMSSDAKKVKVKNLALKTSQKGKKETSIKVYEAIVDA